MKLGLKVEGKEDNLYFAYSGNKGDVMLMPFGFLGFFVFVQISIVWVLRKRLISSADKKKGFKNKSFVIPFAMILTSYSLQGIGYFLQEYMTSNVGDWYRAIAVGDSALCLIMACFVMRIAFAIENRLNFMEYVILFLLNLTALFSALILIGNRI